MAKKLTEKQSSKRGRDEKYPWNKWLNGEVWELTQGTDFDCKTLSFADAARKAANRLEKSVEILADEKKNKVIIQGIGA